MSDEAPQPAVLDPAAPSVDRDSSMGALGWAFFLASSWTWCIGMYLPVILLRDHGATGWWVFAIPNVIGAAAMGWVLTSRAQSRRLVADHEAAGAWFSIVTIAFHLFFSGWIIYFHLGGIGMAGLVVAAAGFWVAGRWRGRGDVLSAVAVWLVSMGIMLFFAEMRHPAPIPVSDPAGAWLLAPVCVFGFLLCPYLDLTFHRARQHTSRRDARIAFTLGFGALFLVMIVFTWMYARARVDEVFTIIGIHMLIQSAFTIAMHARALGRISSVTRRSYAAAGVVPLAGVVAGVVFRVGGGRFDQGEDVYRIFMGFYGLVFPAYVWLCMVPFRGGSPTRKALGVYAAAVLTAMPMFWMGFIAGRTVWLLPGVAGVLLARLAVTRSPSLR